MPKSTCHSVHCMLFFSINFSQKNQFDKPADRSGISFGVRQGIPPVHQAQNRYYIGAASWMGRRDRRYEFVHPEFLRQSGLPDRDDEWENPQVKATFPRRET